MKAPTVEKMAEVDAKRWAAAEMFYGEGAGTRRKLLNAELETKLVDGDYENAFYNAYAALDMNKYAEMAIKERKNVDRAAKASQNLRAIKSGNIRGLSNGIFLAIGVVYIAHVTGYDKKIEIEAKKLYKKAKIEVKFQKARFQGRNVEKIS